MRAGVIITAAGLSSRMGRQKLLLPLGDKTIIEHVVDNARVKSVEEIVVVLGKEKEKIKAVLQGRNVTFAENPDAEHSDMFQSLKYGLKALSGSVDCFFVMPGDMPLVTKACYQCLMAKYDGHMQKGIVKIQYNGRGGHPILLNRELGEQLLKYQGDDGLKGAMKSCKEQIRTLEWPSNIVLADADIPVDYEKIKQIYEQRDIPDRTAIFAMLDMNQTPQNVVYHSMMVEKVALVLAEQARKSGYEIRSGLVSAAALLHDIEKGKPNHAESGAQMLERLGYKNVAAIIREHMRLSEDAFHHLDERAIVYLADKMVKGTEIVDFEERYEEKREIYQNNAEALQTIEKNREMTRSLLERIN